jgi:hypothetical protein
VTALHLLPPVLSLVVLAAHFVRAGSAGMAMVPLGVLVLLAVRRRWAVRVVQVVLFLAAFDWLMTLVDLARWRLLAGQPVLRLVIILGGVSAFTALSALVFRTDRLRARYGLRPPQDRATTG